MEEPTEIKSAPFPEEKHISGICCCTVKSFQSLLLAEGKSFSQLGVCERANPPSLLGSNLNIALEPGKRISLHSCDWERWDEAGTGIPRSGSGTQTPLLGTCQTPCQRVLWIQSFSGTQLQGVEGS